MKRLMTLVGLPAGFLVPTLFPHRDMATLRAMEDNPPPPPNNKYSPNMVYYNILGIFIIRGWGGLLLGGGDYNIYTACV